MSGCRALSGKWWPGTVKSIARKTGPSRFSLDRRILRRARRRDPQFNQQMKPGFKPQLVTNMKMKIKILLARWMANRIEKKSRAKRRALRDQRRAYFEYESREIRGIGMEERRARGLHFYE